MPYDRQVVIALIDGPKIRWHGVDVNTQAIGGNYDNFVNDPTVSAADKREFNRQQGERDTAENLHDKHLATSTLHIVEDCTPNSVAQKNLLRNVIISIPRRPNATMRIYLIAHNDPDGMRFAGLNPTDLAMVVAGGLITPRQVGIIGPVPPRIVTRITLVGCHTAGEATSSADAAQLVDSDSFARAFHLALRDNEILTQVAGYTSYVQISPLGRKRTGFVVGGERLNKASKSKILFDWGPQLPGGNRMQACRFVYD